MAIFNLHRIKIYFVNPRNLKLVSYLIVLNMFNFLSPFSALGLENKFEKSKYFNKLGSTQILEPDSNKFPKLYGENLISQQQISDNLNLNQAIEKFDKAEELILKAFRDFKRGKRYLNNSKRSFNKGNTRILQTKIQSKRATKYLEESQDNYIEGLNYLRSALDSYMIFLDEIN